MVSDEPFFCVGRLWREQVPTATQKIRPYHGGLIGFHVERSWRCGEFRVRDCSSLLTFTAQSSLCLGEVARVVAGAADQARAVVPQE